LQHAAAALLSVQQATQVLLKSAKYIFIKKLSSPHLVKKAFLVRNFCMLHHLPNVLTE
jgi:hypothetical protein